MTNEESEILTERARELVGWGIVEETYPHPQFNDPQITIRITHYGRNNFEVRGMPVRPTYGGAAPVYSSNVHRGQRLDTRIRTAFRRASEAGTEQWWRTRAYNVAMNCPGNLWREGIAPLVDRIMHRFSRNYVDPHYVRYWTVAACQEVIRLHEHATAWIEERGGGWNTTSIALWREAAGGD